ncbi:hypothetical protein [Chamaesiphon polymorphus]|uniref:hypothetical protein n=1 Tax=Chamaesiphon polymorphus TaxID=2107691 RepID=UPI0015E745F6|nr:hypothetical protein [Chamaesiphon polymorphus]
MSSGSLDRVIILVINFVDVDRQWLADQLGMSYTATTSQLHELKKKGLFQDNIQ